MKTQCAVALESGEYFLGTSIGVDGESYGEAVFNTSMTGYQEILTDPSYKSQIISMTYPEIGNYGVADENMESDRVHASGFIIKNYCKNYSNYRAEGSLKDFLIKHNVVAVEGIDTRKLVRILRSTGAKRAVISTIDLDRDSLVAKAKSSPSIENIDLVKEVSTKKAYVHKSVGEKKYNVAAYDFGIKTNILNCLAKLGCEIKVFPASTDPKDILKHNPDGLFLSNGPGDPSALPYAVENVKKMVDQLPIFGICFGHQILSQCLGAETFKLKFGHRGGNQPVINNKKVEITSQNHGFAVKIDDSLHEIEWSHKNCNDNTSEGIMLENKKCFSVQYHPESSPGPHDSLYLFDDFISMMEKYKK